MVLSVNVTLANGLRLNISTAFTSTYGLCYYPPFTYRLSWKGCDLRVILGSIYHSDHESSQTFAQICICHSRLERNQGHGNQKSSHIGVHNSISSVLNTSRNTYINLIVFVSYLQGHEIVDKYRNLSIVYVFHEEGGGRKNYFKLTSKE